MTLVLWVEADDGGKALHHGTVRQRDRECESKKESDERENEKKKWRFFFLIIVFLIFFNYPKKKNDIVLTHLTAIDNWGLTEYRIDNNWKFEDWNDKTEN